jgi:aqualysin 1
MKKKLIGGFLVTALVLSGCGGLNDSALKDANSNSTKIVNKTPKNIIPDQYIVVLKEGDESEALVRSLEQGEAAKVLGQGAGTIKIDQIYKSALLGFSGQLDSVMLEALRADPRVDYIEEDQIAQANTTQNNPGWGLDRIDQATLPLSASYTYNTDASGVNAYVIDTGIRATHSEFAARMGNGFDAVTPGGNANDCHGHGTHVAGTIGGTTYGVAKGVTLHAVRVLDCGGSGTYSGVIAGIDWVKVNHVKPAVANMSLGGGASAALDSAVTNAIASGITFAVAAGNSNANACYYSPARTPNALTVGATTVNDARSGFSNFGTCLDIFAPGSDILSAFNTSDIATKVYSGTSMASPHVAGVVALFLATNPTATPEQVRNHIVTTASANVISNPGPGSPNILVNLLSLSNGHKGMTWTVRNQNSNVTLVGSDTQTDAYNGDTAPSAFRPLLCLYQDGRAVPAGLVTGFYNGWAQGEARVAESVAGQDLTSRAIADARCANRFGAGWRMGEFHDGTYSGGNGGWAWYANGQINRFWVAINDQPANPWNGNGNAMTWTTLGQNNDVAHVGKDTQTNAYSGDTSITATLPMLCIKQDGRAVPAGVTPDFYNGWAQGEIRLTESIQGTSLTSRAAADAVCVDRFGAAWRMAEFHDGNGGWTWYANGQVNRFWTAINDQPANPWN